MKKMVTIKVKIDKFMSVGLEIPQEVELIDFLGITEKVKKLGKTIEMPMEVANKEIDDDKTPTNKVIKDILYCKTKGYTYDLIIKRLQRNFDVDYTKEQLMKICYDNGQISRIIPNTARNYIKKDYKVNPIEVSDEVIKMVMKKKEETYSYYNIANFIKRHLGLTISKEQVRDIYNKWKGR
jgi:hypothetical protein